MTPVFEAGDLSSILSKTLRGCSSNGRAIALHAIGSGIDAHHLQIVL